MGQSKWKKASRKPRKLSWEWVNQPHNVEVSFDLPSKVIILSALFIVLALGVAGTYYTAFVYQPYHANNRGGDPWYPLWNGEIGNTFTSTFGGPPRYQYLLTTGCISGSSNWVDCSLPLINLFVGQRIVMAVYLPYPVSDLGCSGGTPLVSASDTDSNTWFQSSYACSNTGGQSAEVIIFMVNSVCCNDVGSDVVTVHNAYSGSQRDPMVMMFVTTWFNAPNVGVVSSYAAGNGNLNSGSTNLIFNPGTYNIKGVSFIFQAGAVHASSAPSEGDDCGNIGLDNGMSQVGTRCIVGTHFGGKNHMATIDGYDASPPTSGYWNHAMSWSNWQQFASSGTVAFAFIAVELIGTPRSSSTSIGVFSPCSIQYICHNASATADGNLLQFPTTTSSSVILTNGTAIDLSAAVAKALGFVEASVPWNVAANLNATQEGYYAGEQFGYYLTLNDTVPLFQQNTGQQVTADLINQTATGQVNLGSTPVLGSVTIPDGTEYTITTTASKGQGASNSPTNLIYDPNGNPIAGWYDTTDAHISWSNNGGVSWSSITLTGMNNGYNYPSMVLSATTLCDGTGSGNKCLLVMVQDRATSTVQIHRINVYYSGASITSMSDSGLTTMLFTDDFPNSCTGCGDTMGGLLTVPGNPLLVVGMVSSFNTGSGDTVMFVTHVTGSTTFTSLTGVTGALTSVILGDYCCSPTYAESFNFDPVTHDIWVSGNGFNTAFIFASTGAPYWSGSATTRTISSSSNAAETQTLVTGNRMYILWQNAGSNEIEGVYTDDGSALVSIPATSNANNDRKQLNCGVASGDVICIVDVTDFVTPIYHEIVVDKFAGSWSAQYLFSTLGGLGSDGKSTGATLSGSPDGIRVGFMYETTTGILYFRTAGISYATDIALANHYHDDTATGSTTGCLGGSFYMFCQTLTTQIISVSAGEAVVLGGQFGCIYNPSCGIDSSGFTITDTLGITFTLKVSTSGTGDFCYPACTYGGAAQGIWVGFAPATQTGTITVTSPNLCSGPCQESFGVETIIYDGVGGFGNVGATCSSASQSAPCVGVPGTPKTVYAGVALNNTKSSIVGFTMANNECTYSAYVSHSFSPFGPQMQVDALNYAQAFSAYYCGYSSTGTIFSDAEQNLVPISANNAALTYTTTINGGNGYYTGSCESCTQWSAVAVELQPRTIITVAQEWQDKSIRENAHINSVEFSLQRVGAPTGTIYAQIYQSSCSTNRLCPYAVPMGSPLATSIGVDVASMSTSMVPVLFTFNDSQSIPVTEGQSYEVVLNVTAANLDYPTDYISAATTTLVPNENAATFNGPSRTWFAEQYSLALLQVLITGSLPYSPMLDPSVALAVIATVVNPGTYGTNDATIDYTVYMQRTVGQLIGVTWNDNPLATYGCSTAKTVYLCAQGDVNNATFVGLVLNYTGNQNANSGHSFGGSYLCYDFTAGSSTCSVGGFGPFQAQIPREKVSTEYTLPWLNLNQKYYFGYWHAPLPLACATTQFPFNDTMNAMCGRSGTVWLTSAAWQSATLSSYCGGQIILQAQGTCNAQEAIQGNGPFPVHVISVFDPSSGATQTTSFGGWLGSALGGAWNFISGGLHGIAGALAPIFSIGNSIMSTFIGALIQAATLIVQGLILALNAFGNFFHLGNIGDALANFFAGVGNFLINAVVTLFSWIINTTNAIVGFVTFLLTFIVNGVLVTIVQFVVGPLLTLFGILWTVIGILFRFRVPFSFILFLDWMWGMMSVYLNGVRGWLRWINFNIMATTKIFLAIYWLVIEAIVMMERIINFFKGWV